MNEFGGFSVAAASISADWDRPNELSEWAIAEKIVRLDQGADKARLARSGLARGTSGPLFGESRQMTLFFSSLVLISTRARAPLSCCQRVFKWEVDKGGWGVDD